MEMSFKRKISKAQYYFVPGCDVSEYLFSLYNPTGTRGGFTQVHLDKFKELGFDIIVEDLKEKKVIKN